MSSTTIKRKPNSKVTKGQHSDKNSTSSINHQASSSKTILKKNILFPKKNKGKEKLGTTISELEEDQRRPPAIVAAETAVVDLDASGSEYVPSETDG